MHSLNADFFPGRDYSNQDTHIKLKFWSDFLLANKKGVHVDRVYVGSFMTSLEMAGVSITLLHLDETRAHCLGKSCLQVKLYKTVSKDHSVAKRVLAVGLHKLMYLFMLHNLIAPKNIQHKFPTRLIFWGRGESHIKGCGCLSHLLRIKKVVVVPLRFFSLKMSTAAAFMVPFIERNTHV